MEIIAQFDFSFVHNGFHYGTPSDTPTDDWFCVDKNVPFDLANKFSTDYNNGVFQIKKKRDLFEKYNAYKKELKLSGKLCTEIRYIQVENCFFICLDDFFKLLKDYHYLPPKSAYRWELLKEIYKSRHHGFQKGEVEGMENWEYFEFGFTNVYVSYIKRDRIFNRFLPKNIKEFDVVRHVHFLMDNLHVENNVFRKVKINLSRLL